MQEIRRIQAMIGEHESVQRVRKDLKIVDQNQIYIQRYVCKGEQQAWSKRLSKKGRRADALALRADERRDKLRKASGSRK